MTGSTQAWRTRRLTPDWACSSGSGEEIPSLHGTKTNFLETKNLTACMKYRAQSKTTVPGGNVQWGKKYWERRTTHLPLFPSNATKTQRQCSITQVEIRCGTELCALCSETYFVYWHVTPKQLGIWKDYAAYLYCYWAICTRNRAWKKWLNRLWSKCCVLLS